MSNNEEQGEAEAVRQPLPPEVPAPRTEDVETPEADAPWWSKPHPDAAGTSTTEGAESAAAEGGPEPAAGEPRWWGPDAGGQGQEQIEAAHVIGAHVGEAVAAHLPPPPAPEKPKLDLRWMRLRFNIPAVLIALSLAWSGDDLSQSAIGAVVANGPFAVIGWILAPLLVLGLLMVTPVGGILAKPLIDILRNIVSGLARLLTRAWSVSVAGYLLRLLVAVVAWVLVLSVVRLTGRAVITILTGV